MFEWIIENKQWLFSGAGVTIILALMNLFIKKGLIQRLPFVSWFNPISIIPPREIVDAADYLLDLKKHEVYRHFIGLKICWLLTIVSVKRESENGKHVDFHFIPAGDMGRSIQIYCSVLYRHYSELAILKEGVFVRVIGRIQKVSSKEITLNHVELFL